MFSFTFENCIQNYSTFIGTPLQQTKFDHCSMVEIDFSNVNLSGSLLSECDLSGAIFSNTNLEKDHFSTAYNFSIDQSQKRLTKAKFSHDRLEGLLHKYHLEIDK